MNYSKKRGLSDVVTTVLIILLVLAAVAMIWGYLQGTLKAGGQQIAGATECLNLDIKAVSCNTSVNGLGATVKYTRGSANANLTQVNLVFLDASGQSTTVTTGPVPNVLETKVYGATTTTKATSVSVAGTVSTSTGTPEVCDASASVVCT